MRTGLPGLPFLPPAAQGELSRRVSAVSTCFVLADCQVSGTTIWGALHLVIQQKRATSTCSTLAPIPLLRGHHLQPVLAACAGHPIHPVALQTLWYSGRWLAWWGRGLLLKGAVRGCPVGPSLLPFSRNEGLRWETPLRSSWRSAGRQPMSASQTS